MFELVCLYDFGDHGSSHPDLFYKKGFVKIFAKFTVKHLCRSLFFQKQPPEVFCLKKIFLKIPQNSQENTCARASFLIKLQATDLQTLLKKTLGHETRDSRPGTLHLGSYSWGSGLGTYRWDPGSWTFMWDSGPGARGLGP